MNKIVLLAVSWLLIEGLAVPGHAAGAAGPRPVAATAASQIAAAGEALTKLLPRSASAVLVLDLRGLMGIDEIVAAMQAPKFKAAWDEFVEASGIDPKKDVNYVGIGLPASVLMPASDVGVKNIGIVINLKYDRARLQGVIKGATPQVKEEIYNGVPVYSDLEPEGQPAAPEGLAGLREGRFKLALLDPSNVILGDDLGIKGIIDVYTKKAEPLAENPAVTSLVSRVDKSGVAWCAAAYPPECVQKLADSNPALKPLEGLKGLTMALDDKDATVLAVIQAHGGTTEENATRASTLTGLKSLLGPGLTADEPVLAELLSGIAVSSGDDFTRLTVTVTHETIGKLMRMAEPEADDPGSDPTGAGAEWEALDTEADDLYDKGEYERGLEVAKRALEAAEKKVGPDHPDVATSLNIVALLHQAQGQYAEAEALYKRSLEIMEKSAEPDNPDLAVVSVNLGNLYAEQGLNESAEPLFKLALAVREKALGPDHPDVARVLFMLGSLYYDQGLLAQAEPLCQRALAIREKAIGPDHPDVATVLNLLALIRDRQGRYAEAEPLYQRALAIREKALGADHPDVATVLDNLGFVYYEQDLYEEAEPLFKRSLGIREKALGRDHPDVSTVLDDLAALYFELGRFEEAEPLGLRSLAIKEKTLGPDHPDVADTLENMAELYRATDRPKEAEELEARAARIRAIKR